MRYGYALLLWALVVNPFAARAADTAMGRCPSALGAAMPKPGAPPAIAVFHPGDPKEGAFRLPVCTGLNPALKATLVVTLAGTFQFGGTLDDLLARIGSISKLSTVQYWSTTSGKWRPVAYAASALSGPDANSRRSDFAPAELKAGASLYYWENDSRSGDVVIHLSVRERSADGAVLVTDNVTPVKSYFITLFPPGTIQGSIVLRRMSANVWGAYLVSRNLEGSSNLASGHEDSYVNRAVALYRQIAGMKTDQEPPARR